LLISHTHELIYLKTVKTAGTSVEVLLQKCLFPDVPATHAFEGLANDRGIIGTRGNRNDFPFFNHMTAVQLKVLVGEEVFKKYLRVACIRNPYDKMVSWFWFTIPARLRRLLRYMPFLVTKIFFVSWLNRDFPEPDSRIFINQNEVQVDTFLRYENLANDVRELLDRIGFSSVDVDLPNLKSEYRVKPQGWRKYYNRKAAELVYSTYRWEFENFYQKNSWR
jgi:hypothetical protein